LSFDLDIAIAMPEESVVIEIKVDNRA